MQKKSLKKKITHLVAKRIERNVVELYNGRINERERERERVVITLVGIN